MPVNHLVPYDTYIDDSTPSPNAEFLNDWLQEGIIGDIAGTLTKRSVGIDGTGDADATTVPSGTIAITGKAAETTAAIKFLDATSAPGVGVGYNLRFETPSNGVGKVRLYEIRGGWVETINAAWAGTVGAEWARDVNAAATMRVMTGGTMVLYTYAAPPATWVPGAWTGAMSTDTAGNLYGGVNVEAANGNVVANGDPASNQGRVKGKQFVSTASLATAGAGLVVAGVGQAAAPANANVVLAGTDLGGTITVTTGAGVIAGIVATITYTKAFPNGSVVTLTPRDAATAALALPAFTTAGATIWTLNTTGAGALANPGVYVWNYSVSGY